MAKLIENLFQISFKILGFKIDISDFVGTVRSLCNWNTISKTTIWTLATKIHTIIVPIGLSLLTLFFLIDITKKVMDYERMSWERIVFTCIRFLIFKMLIENSFELLSSIMTITNDILTKVTTTISSTGSLPNLSTQMGDLVRNAGGIIDRSFMGIIILILYIPFMGTMIGVLVQVFLRIGKLILSFAFSPIPIAIGTWEDGQNVCKRFIMSTIALGIEASMIVVATAIYSLSLSTLSDASSISSMIAIMFLNGFLMAMISMTSNMAEKWTGG